jgi:AsmA protein
MKRIAWIFAAVLLSALALFALLVALVPREALKAQIGEQIASWTGRDVSLRGEPEISIFPLRVTLNDVHVGGPEGMEDSEILSMDRLTGTIRLLPLVIGHIEVGSYTMVRPLVRLVRDAEGRRNWDFDSGAAALQLAFQGDVPLGDFTLEGGTVVYEDRQSGDNERLDSMSLAVDWPSVRQPIAVEGTGIWRGEQVTVSVDANAPFAFLNGGSTPVETRVESAPISAIFSGQADDYPLPKLAGALKLSTPSLRRFASWLGSPLGPGSTLGQASGFGTAAFDGNGLSVENAEFTLDGNDASGALNIALSPKLDITGTLAFDVLDISPYFAGLAATMSTTTDWRRVALPTDWFGSMNADIRLSASSVRLGELTASDAAASVSLRDGRLEVGLARAVFGGGSLTGNLAFTDSPNAAETAVEAQLRANDIAFALAASTLGLPQAISGTASILVDVSTQGTDLGGLLGELTGTARVSVEDGAVPLFGLADVAASAGGPPNPLPAEGLAATAVNSASAGFSFSGGVGMLERANVVTPSYSADLQGWIGLLDGSLGLNGTLKTGTVAGSAATPAAAPVGFTIDGTLSAPVAHAAAPAQ